MRVVRFIAIAIAILLLAGFGFVLSGVYDVGADHPHWPATLWLLDTTRVHSVAAHSSGVAVPALEDANLVAMGAEHYAEMCVACHRAPGVEESELRRGLYPKPPNLIEHGRDLSPQQTFWIIKHGFKMTGMPAWGTTHDDHSIWAMVAFLRKLPQLTPQSYRELVGQGEGEGDHSEHSGHQHGNAETQ